MRNLSRQQTVSSLPEHEDFADDRCCPDSGRNARWLLLIAMAISAVPIAASPLGAEDWPGFRGKTGAGVSSESDLPTRWSKKKNVHWHIKLPGRANSSPAVVGDVIYLTTQMADDRALHVLAIDRSSGETLWDRKVGSGDLAAPGPKNLYVHRHNAATPSPSADAENVYAFFGSGLLVCLDRSGKEKWKKDLVAEFGAYDITFGMASSPRLWQDRLYVACMTKGSSYVVAFDKGTGDVVWKKDRRYPAEDDGFDAYSTPAVFEHNGQAQLLVSGCDHIDSYDVMSGKRLWFSGGKKIDSPYGRILASPAVGAEIIVSCSGHPQGGGIGRAIAIDPNGSGDITESNRVWTYPAYSPDSPTPVCYEGNVYMVRDDGIASCLDLRTGKRHWRKRLARGPYRASTVAGDGKVYFLSRDGVCTVIQSGPKAKVLAENSLGGAFFATPAISDHTLYLRGHGQLYAIAGQ